MKIKTWKQLLTDPRVHEAWSEQNTGDGIWVQLKPGYSVDGCSCIHEWTKKHCIESLNRVEKKEPV